MGRVLGGMFLGGILVYLFQAALIGGSAILAACLLTIWIAAAALAVLLLLAASREPRRVVRGRHLRRQRTHRRVRLPHRAGFAGSLPIHLRSTTTGR